MNYEKIQTENLLILMEIIKLEEIEQKDRTYEQITRLMFQKCTFIFLSTALQIMRKISIDNKGHVYLKR